MRDEVPEVVHERDVLIATPPHIFRVRAAAPCCVEVLELMKLLQQVEPPGAAQLRVQRRKPTRDEVAASSTAKNRYAPCFIFTLFILFCEYSASVLIFTRTCHMRLYTRYTPAFKVLREQGDNQGHTFKASN